MKFIVSKTCPPIGSLITLKSCGNAVNIVWGESTSLTDDEMTFTSNVSVCRYLANKFNNHLYGVTIVDQCEVDHWLMLSVSPLSCQNNFSKFLTLLEDHLKSLEKINKSYLVGDGCTIADFVIWGCLYSNNQWQEIKKGETSFNCLRKYYDLIENEDVVGKALMDLPENIRRSPPKNKPKKETQAKAQPKETKPAEGSLESMRKEEGKFVELPGAEMGKVVVRFPPEASGYLHIGHAKAALLNQYYKEAFQGTLIMRFDDTNPAKEKVDFEKEILEDLKLLKIYPDKFTHTSDYFDLMLELCEKMLKSGSAYVDDTDPVVMKTDREQRIESKNRNNSVEKNLKMWEEMKLGAEEGQKCCVRAKIDMNSPNGCMRDPTIYRCKNEVHPRTGTKYKVYPTYDFACPIVDSIEGVTHCLRTMEYHDRDAQFYWFIDTLGLRKPNIWEYSRLNMTNTVLSKRKLTWFVDDGHVQGWDDPRMPTVRGILRRGMTVEGLKQFVVAQGSSRSVVVMEWDKIWSFNKKVIDPIAPRYTAVTEDKSVAVHVSGAEVGSTRAPKHPKNTEIGEKTVWTSPKIWIDHEDAQQLVVGINVTFINWGNLKITELKKDSNGIVTEVKAELNLSDKDYKKTLKLTWLADTDKAPPVSCYCVYFDHIISKSVLGKDEDFKSFINPTTQVQVKMLGDPELVNVKQSEIIQLQRKGFFICDSSYKPTSVYSGKESPIILFHIPDGHTKEMPFSGVLSTLSNKKQISTKESLAPEIDDVVSVLNRIKSQGDLIRGLKQKKADKGEIDKEVKMLLSLKEEYKKLTGQEWKPGVEPPKSCNKSQGDGSAVSAKIAQQGDLVRKLKTEKADKAKIETEVKLLLQLKAEYKTLTGQDWKPGVEPSKALGRSENDASALSTKINEQGNLVRKLKSEKADKAKVSEEVNKLLALKTEYKSLTGQDWKPDAQQSKPLSQADSSSLSAKITLQGDLIRKLKADKVEKSHLDGEVKILLALKSEYKNLTGQDWKPSVESATVIDHNKKNEADSLSHKITQQGDIIRKLKLEKANKADIDENVKILLSLKAEYKKVAGEDWKPQPTQQTAQTQKTPETLSKKIKQQGDLVRKLKSDKADKNKIDNEVKVLLTLKSEYKNQTGKDWQQESEKKEMSPPADQGSSELSAKIQLQGDLVRKLKSEKADKETVNEAVRVLVSLKEEFKNVTGREYPRQDNRQQASPPKQAKNKQVKQEKPKQPKKESKQQEGDGQIKKVTRLGLEAKKEENLPEWYSQVITKGELIEYYDVSGCYVLRPWSFAIWEVIRDWFDSQIKKLGVKNCYFPMFVSRSVLEKEKTHIADFAPEVAWVTKSGSSDMAEPVAIRPTSETVMYPAYAKWIQSYRDLPIKLNQWNNVVRWEFKHPQPFLRTREFLWQEGHTAYATAEEAMEEVQIILDLYAQIYSDLLAVPVVKGKKTEKEKFAGGDYTLTTEAFISASGRAIQGATSHHLGQNFSKMFEIIYEDPETQEKKYVYQNSWGVTTRSIGVLIMVHADNQGLVLPPRVASIQVIIVACGITASLNEDEKNKLYNCCNELGLKLKSAGVKAETDLRDNYSPGWKFNHWELKGVPLRVEIGPKDMKANQIMTVRRDTGAKETVSNDNSVIQSVQALLSNIQDNLFTKAKEELESHIKLCKDWPQFISFLENKNLLLSPFCGEISCEDIIKQKSAREDAEGDSAAPAMGAKGLCIPHEQPCSILPTDKCIYPDCKNKPKYYTLFGRSY